jgi:WD40 repeat protein
MFKKLGPTSRVSELDDVDDIPRSVRLNVEESLTPRLTPRSSSLSSCDKDQQKLLKNFDKLTHGNAINQVIVSNVDKNHVFSASMDRFIVLWDISSKKPLRVFEGHTMSVSCIGIYGSSYESMLLFSGGHDGEFRVWKVSSGKCIKVVKNSSSTTISSPYVANAYTFFNMFIVKMIVMSPIRKNLYPLSNHLSLQLQLLQLMYTLAIMKDSLND